MHQEPSLSDMRLPWLWRLFVQLKDWALFWRLHPIRTYMARLREGGRENQTISNSE